MLFKQSSVIVSVSPIFTKQMSLFYQHIYLKPGNENALFFQIQILSETYICIAQEDIRTGKSLPFENSHYNKKIHLRSEQ